VLVHLLVHRKIKKIKNPESSVFIGVSVAYPGGFEPLTFGVGVSNVLLSCA